MSSVAISGNASGAGVLTIAAPNTASNYTLTLPTATTTLVGTDATQTLTNKTITGAVMTAMASSVITSGTVNAGGANPLASGTVVDFTSIPSWVKRISVVFQGVSLSATANILVQLGTGGTPTYTTSGYLSTSAGIDTTSATASATTGFNIKTDGAAQVFSGIMTIINITGNSWVASHVGKKSTTTITTGGGDVALGAVLTAVRITSTSTDTFDAGSINILYE